MRRRLLASGQPLRCRRIRERGGDRLRKKLLLGRTAAFVMAAAIAAGNTVPVQAKGAGEQRREVENLADGKKAHEDKESFTKASPSEPEEERPEE